MDKSDTSPDDADRLAVGALTVYYDGACPLCLREIRFYSGLRGGDRMAWVDVAHAASSALPADLSREQALARFHARRADGSLVSGAPAFLAVWHHLALFRPLARLLDRRWLHGPLDAAYRLFLRVRPALQRLAARHPPEDCGQSCRPRRS